MSDGAIFTLICFAWVWGLGLGVFLGASAAGWKWFG